RVVRCSGTHEHGWLHDRRRRSQARRWGFWMRSWTPPSRADGRRRLTRCIVMRPAIRGHQTSRIGNLYLCIIDRALEPHEAVHAMFIDLPGERVEFACRNLFHQLRVPFLWIESTRFTEMLASLRNAGVEDLAKHVAAHPDFARAVMEGSIV